MNGLVENDAPSAEEQAAAEAAEKRAERAARQARETARAAAKAARRAEHARQRGGIPHRPESVDEYKRRLLGMSRALNTGPREPSKRAVRDALRWYATVHDAEVWQKRPYTAAKAWVRLFDVPFRAVNFAKVCWPDPWDEQRGVDVAVGKVVCEAVADNLNHVAHGKFAERLRQALAFELALCDRSGAVLASTVITKYENPFSACVVQVQKSAADGLVGEPTPARVEQAMMEA